MLSGEVVPAPSRFDAAATIEEVARAVQASADAKGLTLTVRGVADPVELISDELIVRRILGALLDRAVLVTAAGGISIELTATSESIRVGIVDAGPMIPEAERAMLFEPFGRRGTVTDLRPDASGLSLAMAAAMTATLHGTMEVDSDEGGETRLSVTLPGLAMGEYRYSMDNTRPAR